MIPKQGLGTESVGLAPDSAKSYIKDMSEQLALIADKADMQEVGTLLRLITNIVSD